MHGEKPFLSLALFACLALAMPSHAANDHHKHGHRVEHRQHDAHVHGVAALNVVLEADEIHLEFISPAANIVGFEHEPSSAEDKSRLEQAVSQLQQGGQLFVFNTQAGCEIEHAQVTSPLLKHADQATAAKAHAHHEHEPKQDTHSDIEAVYHFECKDPEAITQMTVELFEAFPATGEIGVQYVVGSHQGAKKLTTKNHVLKF